MALTWGEKKQVWDWLPPWRGGLCQRPAVIWAVDEEVMEKRWTKYLSKSRMNTHQVAARVPWRSYVCVPAWWWQWWRTPVDLGVEGGRKGKQKMQDKYSIACVIWLHWHKIMFVAMGAGTEIWGCKVRAVSWWMLKGKQTHSIEGTILVTHTGFC